MIFFVPMCQVFWHMGTGRVRELAQEAQPSDLYPYARKPDTWVQKKIIKKQQKTICLFKKVNQDIEKSWSY